MDRFIGALDEKGEIYTLIENQYIYSRLSPKTVGELVAYHYDIATVQSCTFYVFGLHDNYLIQTDKGKYFVRIYRNEWRNPEEINFELELLNYLKDKIESISSPLKTKNNELLFEVSSPEGEKIGALFTYAEGEPLKQEITVNESKLLGRSVASIHNQTKDFTTEYKRKNLDLEHLVKRSLKVIEPFITVEQKNYLTLVQENIETKIAQLVTDKTRLVACTGDVNPSNFHLTKNNTITLFDFDQCGYGQRAFEIGKFFSSVHDHKSKKEIMQAFLQGYESVHKLSLDEKKAIPYFEIASVLWVMSIRVDNVNKVGYMALGSEYWIQRIGIIEELTSV